MNRKVFNNEIHQAQLQNLGHVKMPLLSTQEVNAILDFIKTLQPDDEFNPKGNQHGNPSTYHCSFLDTNIDYKRKVSSFLTAIFEPYIGQILCGYDILSINFYIKQPGKGNFQIHQNWPTTAIDDSTVTVWCPLQDVSELNGGIHIVEGSHKIVPDIASLLAPIFFKQFEKELIEDYLKPIAMQAAEVLIFDDSLIHWSPQNNSTQPRIAIQIEMIPSDVIPRYYHYDRSTDLFEVFAVNADYYLTHNLSDLMARPNDIKSIGFLKNPNREITLDDFKQKMTGRKKIQEKVYQSLITPFIETDEAPKKRENIFNKLLQIIKQ
jgi:hypothetical protein